MESKTKEIIENFCTNKESFTSLDVSNKVKQEGFPSERHREISSVVRELFINGEMKKHDYGRALIKVKLSNGISANAFLYHHSSVDPSDYDKRSQVALPPRSGSAAPSAQPNARTVPLTFVASNPFASSSSRVINSSSSNKSLTRRQKLDHRLEIPASWIKDLGWNSSTQVNFVKDGSALVIKSSGPSGNETFLSEGKIDKKDRLRVPKNTMIKAGVDKGPGASHLVTLIGDHIVVS